MTAIEPPLQQWELAEIYRLIAPGRTYRGDLPEAWTMQTLYTQIRVKLGEARGGLRIDRGEAIREADEDRGRLRDLRGVAVVRADDDSPCPRVGVILDRAAPLGDQFAWIVWDASPGEPGPAVREALDELTPASRTGTL